MPDPQRFDVEAARKAGYSDQDILGHLTSTRKFDVAGAKKSGYSDAEIIQHLASTPAPESQTEQPPEPSFGQKLLGYAAGAAANLTNTDVTKGAIKGAGRTALNIGQMALSGSPMTAGAAPALVAATESKYGPSLKPKNPAQEWGFMAEQFAEFFIPTGSGAIKAAATAPRWIKILVGVGREALDIGMKTYAQTKDPQAALKAAGVGGAVGAAGEAAAGAKVFSGLKGRLSPKEKEAVAEVMKRGVPVSAADVTGNRVLKAGEQKLGYVIGAIGPMEEHAAKKASRGVEELEKIPKSMPGKAASEVGAGQDVEKALRGRITDLKKDADKSYDVARAELAKTRKTVQTGTTPGSIIDPRTKQLVQVPVMAEVEAPVAMKPIRSALKPYYDELTGRLPETMRESSPGYATLKKIVEGKEDSIDALSLDKDLSTVKGFLRRYGSGLKDKSGRYAAAVVRELEDGVSKAIGDASPAALDALKRGRVAVRQYYSADELLSRLMPKGKSESAIYERLTQSSGRFLPDLKELNRIAPGEVQTVARTYMQGLVDDITKEGRLERLGMARKKLSNLQPEVRNLLFGKQHADKVDAFLRGLQQIGADTALGSAKWRAISESLAVAGTAAFGWFYGHPYTAAVAAGTPFVANRLAYLLTSPQGVTRLTTAMRLPLSSHGFTRALQALGAEAAKADSQPAQEEQTETPPTENSSATPPEGGTSSVTSESQPARKGVIQSSETGAPPGTSTESAPASPKSTSRLSTKTEEPPVSKAGTATPPARESMIKVGQSYGGAGGSYKVLATTADTVQYELTDKAGKVTKATVSRDEFEKMINTSKRRAEPVTVPPPGAEVY